MKEYIIASTEETEDVSVTVKRKDEDGHAVLYDMPHIIYHSPTGLEYGYGGSGPADLALSILADFFEEEPPRRTHSKFYDFNPRWIECQVCEGRGSTRASATSTTETCSDCDGEGGRSKSWYCWINHQDFKWDFIAKMDRNEGFVIKDTDIKQWLSTRVSEKTVS